MVKEGVGLYLYSPSGPSWPVIERIYFFISSEKIATLPSKAYTNTAFIALLFVVRGSVKEMLGYVVAEQSVGDCRRDRTLVNPECPLTILKVSLFRSLCNVCA